MINPGTIVNNMCAHEDFIPTFAAAAGEPDIVEKLRKGHQMGGRTFKVHLDGYNLIPFLKSEAKESPRKEFLYWSDDGDLVALRFENWKAVFKAQLSLGFEVWQRDFTNFRFPDLYNLRSDPFERGNESILYRKWQADRMFAIVPAQGIVAQWLTSFKEFPPRQKPASFSLERVMERITTMAA
jgi:arylsulfatase